MEDFTLESPGFTYPTEKDLKTIKQWDLDKKNVSNLLDLLGKLWRWPDWGIVKRYRYCSLNRRRVLRLELHTGGWPGNEDIIRALMKNFVFWGQYWEASVRGGHYYFEIPVHHLKKKYPKNIFYSNTMMEAEVSPRG